MTIERRLSPEEEELLAKKVELDGLTDQLGRKALELQTLLAEIDSFFRIYNAAVEPKVVESKRLKALIAQAIYALHPTESTRAESRDASASAEEAARDQQGQPQAPSTEAPTFTPSPELRNLYINLVKQAHPDLSRDEEDRLRRTEFMVRVNQAYQDGDEAALQALADEWGAGGGPVEDKSIGEQLVRVIRQIADVRRRLIDVDAEIEEVRNSDDYSLVMQAEEARANGRDLIAEHAAQMDEHIERLNAKIDAVRDELIAVYES